MRVVAGLALAVLSGCAGRPAATVPPASGAGSAAPVASAVPTWLAPYQADVARIVATGVDGGTGAPAAAYPRLAQLTDTIGARLAGSPQLDAAIAWAEATLTADGHEVRREPVMVPHWVRGPEAGAFVAPIARPLRVLGLGGTVATPAGGVTADVEVVHSWDDLKAAGERVRGKLVLFDVPMPAWSEEGGTGYGDVVEYRWAGAIEAARLGAVGMLMRSVTAHSLATLHTGSMGYDDAVPKIPAVAVTVEDAALITRLRAAGPVRVTIQTSGTYLPDAPSANVLAELRGRERPDEIVLLGAHIDSWDVGHGAHDDGAGCVIMMQALATLRDLGLTPRRTIRVVLFTNEENGLRGAKAYAAAHAAEVGAHVLAMEADIGGFAPRGFDLELPTAPDDASAAAAWQPPWDGALVRARLAAIASLLAPLGAATIGEGHAGADIGRLQAAGVPSLGVAVDDAHYFDVHHTDADTLDKVVPADLAANAAAVAAMAYVVAELPARIAAPAAQWPTP